LGVKLERQIEVSFTFCSTAYLFVSGRWQRQLYTCGTVVSKQAYSEVLCLF